MLHIQLTKTRHIGRGHHNRLALSRLRVATVKGTADSQDELDST